MQLPRVQRPPLRRQAADQAEHGGRATVPGTAHHRGALPAGRNASMVIIRLNPIIRGWAAYYRSVVSKKVFTTVDDHLWQLTYRWALRSHPNKSKHWVIARYFGKFNQARQNRWIFGDRDSGTYLRRLDWTIFVQSS